MKTLYNYVCIGGTFDRLHKGHKIILNEAFKIGKKVLIGLCTDRFAIELNKNHDIAPYKTRYQELIEYLKMKRVLSKAKIIPLNDKYGPSITSNKLEAIVVSEETKVVAHKINEVRQRNNLKPLDIFTVIMVKADDKDNISTTRIYFGEIDREGKILK